MKEFGRPESCAWIRMLLKLLLGVLPLLLKTLLACPD